MKAIGFDNQKYLTTQSEQIRKRIAHFGGKLYLEFGGKLFDDFHASRVLPGFAPDSKIQMLRQLKDDVEMVIAINAADIESNKVRGDLGITYDDDVLRLIDTFRELGLYVGSVVLTRYNGQAAANATKIWITSTGKAILCKNTSGIPKQILRKMIRFIAANSKEIEERWIEHFGEIITKLTLGKRGEFIEDLGKNA